MTRVIRLLAAAVVAVALMACGDDDTNDVAEGQDATENAAPCTEVFAPGRPVADVLADAADGTCTGDDGGLQIVAHASWDCPDGATVYDYSDQHGWGLDRDGETWQPGDTPRPYADCVMPGTDAQHP